MPRPKKKRIVMFDPNVVYFKPRAVPLSELEEVSLAPDELEALRLCDMENLSQERGARMMKISQSTYSRIINSARKKITSALVNGKAIKLLKRPEQ